MEPSQSVLLHLRDDDVAVDIYLSSEKGNVIVMTFTFLGLPLPPIRTVPDINVQDW